MAKAKRGRRRQSPLTMQRSGAEDAPRTDKGEGAVVGSAAFWKQKRTQIANEIAPFCRDVMKLRTYAAQTLGIDLKSRRTPVVKGERAVSTTLEARLGQLVVEKKFSPSELARHLLAWRWGVNWPEAKRAAENTDGEVRVLPVDETTGWVMPPTAPGRNRIEFTREDGTKLGVDLNDFVGLNELPDED